MHVTSLHLDEFRRYRALDIRIPAEGLVLIGRNASGKSTLLEAISMLSTTRSSRALTEREIIGWQSADEFGAEIAPYARAEATVMRRTGPVTVAIGLQVDPNRPNRVRKQISVDGKSVRAGKAVGMLRSVLFEPGDIDLVSGAPSVRRRYLDVMLSQIDARYLRALTKYVRIVEHRNRLIKNLVGSGAAWHAATTRQQLDYWDAELIGQGAVILARRRWAADRLSTLVAARFGSFTPDATLQLEYRSTIPAANRPDAYADDSIEQEQQRLAFEMSESLDRERREEFRRGVTLVGPHRDDLVVEIDGRPIAAYGSRGQQRLAVIALKLAETDLMTSAGSDPPVLLLDDVFSELDSTHRRFLADAVKQSGMQTIVTATDPAVVAEAGLPLESHGIVESGVFEWNREPLR